MWTTPEFIETLFSERRIYNCFAALWRQLTLNCKNKQRHLATALHSEKLQQVLLLGVSALA